MPRWPRVWWLLGPVLAVTVLAMVVGAVVKVPYLNISPGNARPTSAKVEISGAPTYRSRGEVLFTTVQIGRPTGIEAVWGWLAGDIDVVPDQVINGDRSDAESRAANRVLMDTSKLVAAQVALQLLGYDVKITGTGVDVVAVEAGLPVSEELSAGDVIVGIDGEPVTVTDELIERIRSHRPGDHVTLEVERNGGGTEEVTVTLSPRPDNPDAPMLGVSIRTRQLGFDLPFEVEVDTGEVGGPSAGLAITLAVLDRLTPGSITGGRRVAVTGEIFSNGEVGIVGGVAQKTVAAREADAEVFIVPRDEYETAKAHAGHGLRVEPAGTLQDALRVLDSLGGNALSLSTPGDEDPG
jgi:PDZ domain-containing protein